MNLTQSFEVHIEELVFEGIGAADAVRLAATVAGELTRLLSERPVEFTKDYRVEDLRARTVHVNPAAPAERTGERLAFAIHESLAG